MNERGRASERDWGFPVNIGLQCFFEVRLSRSRWISVEMSEETTREMR